MKRFNNSTLKIVCGLVAAIIVLLLIFFGMTKIEDYVVGKTDKESLSSAATSSYAEEEFIYHNGKKYTPKENLTTLLVLGIDDFGKVRESVSYTNSRQADFLALLVFDSETDSCSLLQLNRDTMAEIQVLGVTGEKAGTINGQLALAHTYGNGLESSCKNTSKAVSDLLYGIEIDNYLSINMDAVAALNDLVGGVEVEILDDFSDVDTSLKTGNTVLLSGEQALTYVRSRGNVGDQTNVSRMQRQRQYMSAFASALKTAYLTNENIILDAYNAIVDYMVTDCSITDLSETAEKLSSYSISEIVSPEGESVKGDEFIEFHVDDESLKELVINTFYEETE